MAEYESNQNINNKIIFCSQCGTKLEDIVKFCPVCGYKQSTELGNSVGVVDTVLTNDFEHEQKLIEAFIGKDNGVNYYKKSFRKFETGGSSWNWSWWAFFCSLEFLIYKKVYFMGPIIILYVLCFLIPDSIISIITFLLSRILTGGFATKLIYKNYINNRNKVKQFYKKQEEQINEMSRLGGVTSPWKVLLISSFVLALFSNNLANFKVISSDSLAVFILNVENELSKLGLEEPILELDESTKEKALFKGTGAVSIVAVDPKKFLLQSIKNSTVYIDGKKRGVTGDEYTTLIVEEGDHEVLVHKGINEYSYYEGSLNIFVGSDSYTIFNVNVEKKLTKLGMEKIEKEEQAKKEALEKETKAEEMQKTLKDKAEFKRDNIIIPENEYFAIIQALVYEHFNPPESSEGNTVKAVLELSAFGKVLDFKILTYSSNDALNKECDNMKNRLKRVLFPANPNNKSSALIINLDSESE